MQSWPSKTLTASLGSAWVSRRSACTLLRSSPRACAAAAWAHDATTTAFGSPASSAIRRASAALAVPTAGSPYPSAAAPANASACAIRPSMLAGSTPSSSLSPPGGSPSLICARACFALRLCDSGSATARAAAS